MTPLLVQLYQGEEGIVGINVYSTSKKTFVIDSATCKVFDKNDAEFDTPIVSFDTNALSSHDLKVVFGATQKGEFIAWFTYVIGPEIHRIPVYIKVI